MSSTLANDDWLWDGDAPEIDHGEILWNAAYELIRSLDAASDAATPQVGGNNDGGLGGNDGGGSGGGGQAGTASEVHLRQAKSLNALRHVLRALTLRRSAAVLLRNRGADARSSSGARVAVLATERGFHLQAPLAELVAPFHDGGDFSQLVHRDERLRVSPLQHLARRQTLRLRGKVAILDGERRAGEPRCSQ